MGMDEHLWRLSWALPLVIVIGVGLIFWLKKLGLGVASPAASTAGVEPVVLSNTTLTDQTRVLLVEVAQQRFVVFESSAHIVVQPSAEVGLSRGGPFPFVGAALQSRPAGLATGWSGATAWWRQTKRKS